MYGQLHFSAFLMNETKKGGEINQSKVLKKGISQRGGSPFVCRDRVGWPAALPYICVSVAIGTRKSVFTKGYL